MPKYSITYSERKKQEIEKAIEKLEDSTKEYQKIGPEETSVRTWVTRGDSKLQKEINNGKNKYKKYLPYYYKNVKYCIFAFSKKDFKS